ncbi:hypothetical protein [Bradyrhizobium sp. HKCCYLR20261]|uniref:hypothetical protein n=1 Tax=Bradyrhizobium sp. HKCCYLR20261 TaxID=3420760 RepID=UPI003EC0642C
MSINNIVFFRGNVAAPELREDWTNVTTRDRSAEQRRDAYSPRVANRVVPIMVWQRNPVSKRPECRWVLDNDATDEGVSCSYSPRRAA